MKCHMLILAHLVRADIPKTLRADYAAIMKKCPLFLEEMINIANIPRPPAVCSHIDHRVIWYYIIIYHPLMRYICVYVCMCMYLHFTALILCGRQQLQPLSCTTSLPGTQAEAQLDAKAHITLHLVACCFCIHALRHASQ